MKRTIFDKILLQSMVFNVVGIYTFWYPLVTNLNWNIENYSERGKVMANAKIGTFKWCIFEINNCYSDIRQYLYTKISL